MRALFSFFFLPMNNGLLTKLPHKKKHPKKTKKKKEEKKKMSEQQPASSPPANRLYVGNIPWSTTVEELQALFADATSVEIPTVRVFVFVFCRRCVAPRFVFLFRVALLKRAPKRATTMAIKIERAPIHSMMGFAHPIGAEGSTRDAASPDHPLSLSRRETT